MHYFERLHALAAMIDLIDFDVPALHTAVIIHRIGFTNCTDRERCGEQHYKNN